VAVKDTSVAAHVQSAGEIDNNYRYLAPEIQSPESYGMDKILISKESDVYGIGMIAYEVSSHRPVSSGPRVKSHVDLPGVDGEDAVLRIERCQCVPEDTGRGNASTTL